MKNIYLMKLWKFKYILLLLIITTENESTKVIHKNLSALHS